MMGNKKKTADGLIWKNNSVLFFHEQYDIPVKDYLETTHVMDCNGLDAAGGEKMRIHQ